MYIGLYLRLEIWDLGWWGEETKDLQIKPFAQEWAKVCLSNNLPLWLSEPVAVIHVYLSKVPLLLQLPPLLPAHSSSAWGDNLNLTWIFQSEDLHSRSQQPLHSSFFERMSEQPLAYFQLSFICGIPICFGGGNNLPTLHEATCD